MALVVFTGGARSGKSSLAQELARVRSLDGVPVTVVVFGDESTDSEMAERIERHRADRPDSFRVIEAADSSAWLDQLGADELVLIDCLGSLVARVMEECMARAPEPVSQTEEEASMAPNVTSAVESRVNDVLDAIVSRHGDTIVVTNEVGDGVVPAYPSGRLFRDVLGRANRRLVRSADVAYLVVCGRTLDLSALPTTVRWPSDE